ncbi:MAG: DUF917 family protein [Sulfobacillus sp.]|nr:DUF917 family protein [Sulfobacillus sp.]
MCYGQRVTVYAMPCDPVWRSVEGLNTVGPGYFGYDLTYVPLDGTGSHESRRTTHEVSNGD